MLKFNKIINLTIKEVMESKNLINSKPVSKYILEYIFNKSEAGQR